MQDTTSLSYPVAEDCLQLNVWAPVTDTANTHRPESGGARAPRNTLLPVLVWACGGGLTSCSGREFNGSRLSQLGSLVVVSV